MAADEGFVREIRVRRAYEEPEARDGTRVLVDRLWPRGLSKDRAHFDEWVRAAAPSTELRTWYGHDPARYEAFAGRYRAELTDPGRAEAVEHLGDLAARRPLTLLTGTKDLAHSHAQVLADVVRAGMGAPGRD
ncbi:DUF488 domain-containing protein [Streptomyces sp. NPDC007088]|uniref:DUF488 domain-containing protein n=1 Tax=Streptomyces sp. NPDC007088 TaxID=3364773 RepID=UPI0036AAC3F9